MKLNETWDVVCMTGLRLSEEGHNARMCVWFVLSGVRGKRRVEVKNNGKGNGKQGGLWKRRFSFDRRFMKQVSSLQYLCSVGIVNAVY